jgi:hypothetical protein
MERLSDAVVRVKDGEWLCRVAVVFAWINGPSVALTPGVVYRKGVRYENVDIAEMLDNWLATDRLPLMAACEFPDVGPWTIHTVP